MRLLLLLGRLVFGGVERFLLFCSALPAEYGAILVLAVVASFDRNLRSIFASYP